MLKCWFDVKKIDTLNQLAHDSRSGIRNRPIRNHYKYQNCKIRNGNRNVSLTNAHLISEDACLPKMSFLGIFNHLIIVLLKNANNHKSTR